ncbi:MAG: tetratricopeptide repeat protein [Deltaproteobacteria bacterium]|nr:tetratricopeptide repeat protein [Deltaproteobacteria bacterium]MBN2674225.1 tetratricopeptide repeat protein [Deltaproteobacteria bacterium]
MPAEITAANVSEQEKIVFSLDEKNPSRKELRNKLVKYYFNVFEHISEDDSEGRLAQFYFVLSLHEPADFRTADVSVEAAPMAEWVVNTFEPQGKEALVLAGLIYLSMAHPENSSYEQRYMSLLDWSEDVRKTIKDPIERAGSLSAMYGTAVRMVPHKVLLDRLASALADRQKAVVNFLQMFAGNSGGFSPFMFHSVISQGGIGKEFVRAYFLGDYLDKILDKMEEFEVTDGIEEELLTLLSQLQENKNVAHNYHQLAQVLGPGDPAAGVRACMRAHRSAPKEPRYALCVGRFFSNMDRQLAAIDYYAEAVSLDSGNILVQAMEQVQEALYRVHMSEQGKEVAEALRRTESIVSDVRAKGIDDEAVSLAASSLIETAAVIEFDDGNIDSAHSYFDLAQELWPSRPTPITKIAEIYYWQGQYQRATEFLTKAMSNKMRVGGAFADYWRAMIYEQRGDCYLAMGNVEDAAADYELALNRWDIADYPLEQEPVIAIRRGILLSHLGRNEESMEKFREAIQLSPDRRSSYADILSFLVVSKRLEDAEEFYRLAFNQDMLAGMWKIYFSIWVDGLSRMQTGKSYDLAYGYLQNSASDSWQEKLASFYIGTIDASALRKFAQNKGHEVEADYYEALLNMVNNQPEKAKAGFQRVLDSNLFAFFEYRMAKEFLKSLQ